MVAISADALGLTLVSSSAGALGPPPPRVASGGWRLLQSITLWRFSHFGSAETPVCPDSPGMFDGGSAVTGCVERFAAGGSVTSKEPADPCNCFVSRSAYPGKRWQYSS